MQPHQTDDQQTDPKHHVADVVDVIAEVVMEPEAGGAVIGVVGETVQSGAAQIVDGVCIFFELVGDVLAGLCS